MKLSMMLSPGIWDLLERLRPHLDVTLDLFDPSLAPLVPDRAGPSGRVVRQLMAAPPDAGTGQQVQAALRTGQHQVFEAAGMRLAIFPLRHDRVVIGLLTLAEPAKHADHDASTAVLHRLERLGWSLRATIEADVRTHERLGGEERRSRWLASTLRFLEHLYHFRDEHDLFSTLVEGAAIWGDFDARVYRRSLADEFVLEAALPSVIAAPHTSSFPVALLAGHAGVARISSIAELEQLGWSPAVGEILLMPVPGTDPAECLLTVGGLVDAEFEHVFTVACRTLGTCLELLAASRARSLRERLRQRLATCRLRFPAPATALLGDLASATRATDARLLLRETPGGPPRVLAAVGGSPVRRLPSEFPAEGSLKAPDRLVFALQASAGSSAWLDLGRVSGRLFGPSDALLAEAALPVIEAWLNGALQALSSGDGLLSAALATRGFEARIQEEIERARRFNLEAGLLVVASAGQGRDQHALAVAPLVEAIRTQLRATDLVGRLANGDVAALLVQTCARGVATVADRIQQRLLVRVAGELAFPGTMLGKALYPSAGETAAALVQAARDDLARQGGATGRPAHGAVG